MYGKKILKGLGPLSLLLLFLGVAHAAPSPEPIGVIKQAVDEIVTVLQDKKLQAPALKDERRQRVGVTVERYFDFDEMSMRTLARHWKERTPAERKHFAGLFKQLLQRTYFDRVDSYCRDMNNLCTNEVVLIKKQELQGNKAIVYTAFVRNNVETPVEYKLMSAAGKWMVYDVVIEGVSLVRNYRSQFESIVAKEQYSGLVAKMEEKIKKNEPLEDVLK